MKKARWIIGLLLVIAAIVATNIIRITNPDMTELRLFVTYWRCWLLIAFGIGGGAVMLAGGKL